MSLDFQEVARLLSLEIGLAFRAATSARSCSAGVSERDSAVELVPSGHSPSDTFILSAKFGWRHLEVDFLPGNFAGDLLCEMVAANKFAKLAFVEGIRRCVEAGATVRLLINEAPHSFEDTKIWEGQWNNFEVGIRKGQMEVGYGDAIEEQALVVYWMTQLMNSILPLLPIEQVTDEFTEPGVVGYPEGALVKIWANKYERDPKNRAAAFDIHGRACVVCEQDLSEIYGPSGFGVVEVHHTTPLSEVRGDYLINPEFDLVPLCPNCHTIVHRRNPPFSIQEVKEMCRQFKPHET